MEFFLCYNKKKVVSKDKKALYGTICSHSIVSSSENLSHFQDFTDDTFSLTIKEFCIAVNSN